MNATIRCFVFSMAVLAAIPAGAQEAVRLTLAEALERARTNSPRLESLTALEAAAEAAGRGARAERLPLVDLAAGYTRNSNVEEFKLTLPGVGTRTLFPNIPNNSRLHAGASVPLYTGGRIESAIAAADRQREAAAMDRSGAVNDLLLETQTAYWNLVMARESARVLAEAVGAYEAHLKDAKNRYEMGTVASNEVLAVQVERDRAELTRLQAENAAAVVNENLIRLVGLPPGSKVEPAEALTAPPASSDTAAALFAAAQASRPEILALQARARAARAAVDIQRSVTRPQASLSLGYDYADPNPRIVPPRDEFRGTWSAGVTVALRAFDGGRAAAAAAQASAQADALDRQVEDLKSRLRVEVTSRTLELDTARAALALAGHSLEAAKENVRVARDRYQEGVIPSSELLDAETALLRAGLDQTSAATQVRVALANLDRAVGR
ncbi:MAG: outer membrane protein [Acidobacteriota bacterium]|jgi:outer membrane protein TolC|nr:outer membrane protein [Acidobacteriota bacterium]